MGSKAENQATRGRQPVEHRCVKKDIWERPGTSQGYPGETADQSLNPDEGVGVKEVTLTVTSDVKYHSFFLSVLTEMCNDGIIYHSRQGS